MGERILSIGDVVRHRILGREKIIVGIGQDRYLCVYREDVREDGRLKPNARVAMHRQENLHKIGRLEAITPIGLESLYGKELKQTRRLRRHTLLKEEIVPYTLFIVAMGLIVLAVLSTLQKNRSHIGTFFQRNETDHRK